MVVRETQPHVNDLQRESGAFQAKSFGGECQGEENQSHNLLNNRTPFTDEVSQSTRPL